MLTVKNVLTGEVAMMTGDSERERRIADKLVQTLRRNGRRTGERGSDGWTVIESAEREERS